MKQTTLFALAAASSFACVSASAAIQVFNDDFSSTTKSTRWNDPNEAVTVANGVASIDADTEVPYYTTYDGTPSGDAIVTTLKFDVVFTPATTKPKFEDDAKLQLYVDNNGTLLAMVDANSEPTQIATGITAGSSSTITISVTPQSGYAVQVGDATAVPVANTSAAAFSSVGFLGTGTVDNFVGSYGSTATNEGSSDTSSDAAVSVSGNTVTGHFATTVNNNALKFIKVTTGSGQNIKTYTLRYVDGQTITLPSNAGTVQSVVAYYGNNVSAIPDDYEATAVVSQVADETSGKVGVSVEAAQSGLYYSLKAGNRVVAKELVAPADHGKPLSLTFDPAVVAAGQADWGKTTITFQATDDDPGNVAAGE